MIKDQVLLVWFAVPSLKYHDVARIMRGNIIISNYHQV